MFLMFEKIIMEVDNTKMIQLLIFHLAESSIQQCSSFLTLLLITIMENYENKRSKRKFIVSLQFLRCYLKKSLIVTPKLVKKVFLSLAHHLKMKLERIENIEF